MQGNLPLCSLFIFSLAPLDDHCDQTETEGICLPFFLRAWSAEERSRLSAFHLRRNHAYYRRMRAERLNIKALLFCFERIISEMSRVGQPEKRPDAVPEAKGRQCPAVLKPSAEGRKGRDAPFHFCFFASGSAELTNRRLGKLRRSRKSKAEKSFFSVFVFLTPFFSESECE